MLNHLTSPPAPPALALRMSHLSTVSCSRDASSFDPSNPRGTPLLHRLVFVGGSFKYKLEGVVDCSPPRGVTRMEQVMDTLEQVRSMHCSKAPWNMACKLLLSTSLSLE